MTIGVVKIYKAYILFDQMSSMNMNYMEEEKTCCKVFESTLMIEVNAE